MEIVIYKKLFCIANDLTGFPMTCVSTKRNLRSDL